MNITRQHWRRIKILQGYASDRKAMKKFEFGKDVLATARLSTLQGSTGDEFDFNKDVLAAGRLWILQGSTRDEIEFNNDIIAAGRL